jgi:segregation and condensation protein A
VVKKNDGSEPEDPRAELVRRLLEYERIKLAAQKLDEHPQRGRDFLVTSVFVEERAAPLQPDVSLQDLATAWADVIRRAKLVQHHKISREELSVREHMSLILKRLQSVKFVEFSELFDAGGITQKGVQIVVVHFIALLELAKETLVEITQAEPYAPIYVRLSYAAA